MTRGKEFSVTIRCEAFRLLERQQLGHLSYRQAATVLKRKFGDAPGIGVLHSWQKKSLKGTSSTLKRGRPVKEQTDHFLQAQRIERYLRNNGGQAPAADLITNVAWMESMPNSVASKYRFINQMASTKRVVPIAVYPLTASDKRQRVKMAKKYHGVDQSKWHFQDESGFTLCGKTAQSVIRLKSRGKATRITNTHNHIDLMVWGCISADGTAELQTIDGTLTADKHHKYLINYLVTDETVIIDGARPHSTKRHQDDLDMFKIRVIRNPARSPDINPIEMVWGMVKKLVYKGNKIYRSVAALEAAVYSAWKSVTENTEYLQSIVAGLQHRYTTIIRTRGDRVHA